VTEPAAPRPVLAVVPVRLADADALDPVLRCLVSLRATAPDAAILVLDHGSRAPHILDALEAVLGELGAELVRADEPLSRTATLNVGLQGALDYGFDAVLVDSGLEFRDPAWLPRMAARTDSQGRPAAVVGARLLDERGLLWHAGVYLSLLRLEWFHRFHLGPADLPEALQPCRCPVSGSLALIRHETLTALGLLDPSAGPLADVEYCLRAFKRGLESIYEPQATAALVAPSDGRAPEAELFAANGYVRGHLEADSLAGWIPDAL